MVALFRGLPTGKLQGTGKENQAPPPLFPKAFEGALSQASQLQPSLCQGQTIY